MFHRWFIAWIVDQCSAFAKTFLISIPFNLGQYFLQIGINTSFLVLYVVSIVLDCLGDRFLQTLVIIQIQDFFLRIILQFQDDFLGLLLLFN